MENTPLNRNHITVSDIVEHEDGSATITWDNMSEDDVKFFSEIGLKFILYCAAYNFTIDEAFDKIAGKNNG